MNLVGQEKNLMQIFKKSSRGFTLLEILLVVGIIAILAGIVIVAINPSRQLATVRNTERKSDIKQIDSALTQYYIDNFRYPTSLSSASTLTEICDTGANASSSGQTTTCTTAGLINLSELVPTYLTAIPRDPSATTTDYAGYQVVLASNKIGLSAPAELGQTITIGTVAAAPEEEVDACGTPGDATDPDCWSAVQGSMNWTAAGAACADLVGYDWRLPILTELEAGLTAQFVTVPPTVTGFAEGSSYWSSAEYVEGVAWLAYYYGGTVSSGYDLKNVENSVRCVR